MVTTVVIAPLVTSVRRALASRLSNRTFPLPTTPTRPTRPLLLSLVLVVAVVMDCVTITLVSAHVLAVTLVSTVLHVLPFPWCVVICSTATLVLAIRVALGANKLHLPTARWNRIVSLLQPRVMLWYNPMNLLLVPITVTMLPRKVTARVLSVFAQMVTRVSIAAPKTLLLPPLSLLHRSLQW